MNVEENELRNKIFYMTGDALRLNCRANTCLSNFGTVFFLPLLVFLA